MLRLIENQIRSELLDLQRNLNTEMQRQTSSANSLLFNKAANSIYHELMGYNEEYTLSRNEHDNIWLVEVTLDMACNQPNCPICSEEFVHEEMKSMSHQLADVHPRFATAVNTSIASFNVGAQESSLSSSSSSDRNRANNTSESTEYNANEAKSLSKLFRNTMDQRLLCLPCSHIYHKDCVIPWLQSKHTCPICRYELSGDIPTTEVVSKMNMLDIIFKIIIETEENVRKYKKNDSNESAASDDDKGKGGALARLMKRAKKTIFVEADTNWSEWG